jgi:hypothetical protein
MNGFKLLPLRRIVALGFLVLLISSVTVVASAAPTIRILRGAGQQTTYGSDFPAPFVVWVTDPATERAVPGIRVNFKAGAGIGLSSDYAITDEYGLASVTGTGLAACSSSVAAEVAAVPEARATFADLDVEKAPLTVVPVDLKSIVGSGIPAATDYTFKGFVNGDTEESAGITGTPVLSTTATDHSPRANYAIKGGIGTLSARNYSFVAGFGTLAILEKPTSGRQNSDGQTFAYLDDESESFIIPPTLEETEAVRPALDDQPVASAVIQPNFIAGLRGESGIFVRAAIWPSSSVSLRPSRVTLTQGAIFNQPLIAATIQPTYAAGVRNSSEVMVRSLELPKTVTLSSITKVSSTRAAISAPVSDLKSGSVVPVHAAISAAPANSNTQRSYTAAEIRKAFVSSGTK